MNKEQLVGFDPEITAIGAVHKALEKLAPDARARVFAYVAGKLGISLSTPGAQRATDEGPTEPSVSEKPADRESGAAARVEDGLDSVSPVAKKWMARNNLSAVALGKIFSLGGDEIDLIAKKVPGKSKRERMYNVFLLKGVAAYLASGAARFAHDQVREACVHYDAYDSANFATYLKSFSADISGDKGTGYALTPRGLSSGTDVIQGMSDGSDGSQR